MKQKKRPIEAYFASILLAIMLIFLTMEVIARYIFNYSFVWTEELARYLFVWFVYLTSSYAIYEKAHIKIDSVMSIYSSRLKIIAKKIGTIILFGLHLFVAYLSLIYTVGLFEQGNRSQVTGLLLGIFYLGIPIGFTLSSIRLLVNLFEKNEKEKSHNSESYI